ncbi:FMN-binding protein [Niallia sp. Krafla_26]|uniref:FMN-binding protein n=1 Tax=Niallia sp. Krafla_26 TaxID=3064703 RepID=UPI003D1674BA
MKKKLAWLALSAAIVLPLSACGNNDETADTANSSESGTFKAGTYTASADGNNGPVTVEVVFTADKMESIAITEQGESVDYIPAVKETVDTFPDLMVEKQSLDIDVLAGATNTGKAVKYAVADAVKQAGGEDNALLAVDLDKAGASEAYFEQAAKEIEKPEAVDGVIEVKSYDDLKKALGYYAYIVNPDTEEGKFVYVDGSAADGDTIKLTSDLTAEGEKANPNNAGGADKADVITGATVIVTDSVTIDGNGKIIKGEGYPTLMFTGKDEELGSDAIETTVKHLTVDGAGYTAKMGGSMFVLGASTLNFEDSSVVNGAAKSNKLHFNGGGAIYANSHGLTPDQGRAVLNVKNSTFTGNTTASGAGGAIMAYNADVNIYDSKFTGNKSLHAEHGSGGAIAMRDTSKLVINGSEITGNEATVAGGGIYILDGESPQKEGNIIKSVVDATITNSVIKDNVAANGADVVFGRYYSDTYDGDKTRNGLTIGEGNTIGDQQDITFADLERTTVSK